MVCDDRTSGGEGIIIYTTVEYIIQAYNMSDSRSQVLKALFDRPEYRYHLRELARATGLNPNTVSTVVDRLEEEGIVARERRKHLVEIRAGTGSTRYRRAKQLDNIGRLYSSGLVDHLVAFYDDPEAVVLIGSYSRGEDWSESDIDIAVVTSSDEHPDLGTFEAVLKRSVHLLVVEKGTVSDEFTENLANGIVVHGRLSL